MLAATTQAAASTGTVTITDTSGSASGSLAQYSQVSTREEEQNDSATGSRVTTSISVASSMPLSTRDYTYAQPQRLRQSTHGSTIPEARELTWEDSYYDGKYGIVAAFDRDGHGAGDYFQGIFRKLGAAFGGFAALYWMLAYMDAHSENPWIREQTGMDEFFGFYMAVFALFFVGMGYKAKQEMLLQHVAVTTEGVRIDNTGSAVTVTIPLEHILSINLVEAKAGSCNNAATPQSFQTIRLQRTAAPMEQVFCQKSRKVDLLGIIKAQELVTLVQAMKEAQIQGTYRGVLIANDADGQEEEEAAMELPNMA